MVRAAFSLLRRSCRKVHAAASHAVRNFPCRGRCGRMLSCGMIPNAKLRASVAFAAAMSASSAIAGCDFEPQGEGRVGAVIDARSFRMEDGREVRLAGIEMVSDGSAALATL